MLLKQFALIGRLFFCADWYPQNGRARLRPIFCLARTEPRPPVPPPGFRPRDATTSAALSSKAGAFVRRRLGWKERPHGPVLPRSYNETVPPFVPCPPGSAMSLNLLRITGVLLGVLLIGSWYQSGSVRFASTPVPDRMQSVAYQTSASGDDNLFDGIFNEELLNKNPLSPVDQMKADALVGSVKTSEWLGPLAPIAISPFFGITCLCLLSQFGGDYLPMNSFISSNPVLNSPTVLWVFVGLTLLTSLPRLTKVSKPAAQAIDQVEAWAGIITLLVIRFAASQTPAGEGIAVLVEDPIVRMGFIDVSADVLLSLAAVINIVVINTVKFFYEMMVWLIPFPFVDAMLEAGNKLTCAGLMGIYAYSPTVATFLNLILFVVCLLMFAWIKRRVGYMRSILLDPIMAKVSQSFGVPVHDHLHVFPDKALGPFPAKARLMLRPSDDGWQLERHRFLWRPRVMVLSRSAQDLAMRRGFLVNRIELTGEVAGKLLFTRRYSGQLEQLSRRLGVPLYEGVEEVVVELAEMGV